MKRHAFLLAFLLSLATSAKAGPLPVYLRANHACTVDEVWSGLVTSHELLTETDAGSGWYYEDGTAFSQLYTNNTLRFEASLAGYETAWYTYAAEPPAVETPSLATRLLDEGSSLAITPEVGEALCGNRVGWRFLYIAFTPIDYWVAYDLAGGTLPDGVTNPTAATYDQPFTVHPPLRTGHTFTGWTCGTTNYYAGAASDITVSNLTATAGATVTLVATYRTAGYTVRFDGNGSTSGSMDDQTFLCGEGKTLSQNRYGRTGYAFSGWCLDPAGEAGDVCGDEACVTNLVLTADGSLPEDGMTFTLYAQWEPIRYTIRFEGNGEAVTGSMTNLVVAYDQSVALPQNAFVNPMQDFQGWYDASTGLTYADGETVARLRAEAEATVTLQALWTMRMTVLFHADGGAEGAVSQVFEKDVEDALLANAFARTGYAFSHWTNATGRVYEDQALVENPTSVGATLDLYAVWEPNAYQVLLDPGEGGNAGAPVVANLTYDAVTVLAKPDSLEPPAPDYVFIGWATSRVDAVSQCVAFEPDAVIPNLTALPGDHVRLYAVWQIVPGPMSEALGCANLKFRDGEGDPAFFNYWKPLTNGVAGSEGYFTCLKYCADKDVEVPLMADVNVGGTLSFEWRTEIGASPSGEWNLSVEMAGGYIGEGRQKLFTATEYSETWHSETCSLARVEAEGTLAFKAKYGYYYPISLRNVRWVPDTAEIAGRKVTFDLGTNGVRVAGGDLLQTVAEGSSALEPTVEVAPGWDFTGWFDTEGRTNVAAHAIAARTVATDVVFVARYEPHAYRITYANVQGRVNPNATSFTCETPSFEYVPLEDADGNAAMGFAGWEPRTFERGTTGDVIVRAHWGETGTVSNRVTFVCGLDLSETNEIWVCEGEEVAAPPVADEPGYSFVGWKNGCGDIVTDIPPVTEAVSYMAVLTANVYTVAFAGGEGATGTMATQAFEYDRAQALASNRFAKAGFGFAGWKRAGDGETTAYGDGEVVMNLATGGEVALVAQWRESSSPDPGSEVQDDVLPLAKGYGVEGRVGVKFRVALGDDFAGAAVKGLPSGLRFAARQVKDATFGVVAAGTLYGVPVKAATNAVVFTKRVRVGAKVVSHQATASVAIAALPTWAVGTFNGRFADGLGTATLTVSATGRASGKIVTDGSAWSFSAAGYEASEEGEETFVIAATSQCGRATSPVLFAVGEDGADGTFGGRVLELWRNVWKDAGATDRLRPYVGLYTVRIASDDTGCGYLSLTLDAKGNCKATGKLPDGTGVSATLPLAWSGGTAAPFAIWQATPGAYKGGCVGGLLTWDAARAVAGDGIAWVSKSPTATGEYGAGFSRTLSARGAYYDRLATLADYYTNLAFSAAAPALETTVRTTALVNGRRTTTSEAGETAAAVLDCWGALEISLDAKGTGFSVVQQTSRPVKDKASGAWLYEGANDAALTFSFTKATGIFRGTFTCWYDYVSAIDETKAPAKETATHASRKFSYGGAMVLGESLRGYYLVDRTGSRVDETTLETKTYRYRESRPMAFVE